MKAFVFTDEALRGQAGRFVWLSVDTEKARNATLVKKLGVLALPSYFIVEPDSGKSVMRWVGGASVKQLGTIFDDGYAAMESWRSGASPTKAAPAAGASDVDRAEEALRRADQLYADGKNAEAAEAYFEAISAAPDEWASFSRAVESLLLAWSLEDRCEPAVKFAFDVLPRLQGTGSAASVASTGLDCALQLPEDNPRRKEMVSFFETAANRAAEDRSLPLAADDRSGLYITLMSAREAAHDSVGAHAVAVRWSAFLDSAAAAAPTPEARTVFDSHRLSAYIELGTPERAIPMLEASEKALPEDYNPPYRLSVAYRNMKKWDEALAASSRALARAYGPRKLMMLQSRADLFSARGDRSAARTTLEEALRTAKNMPEGQRSERSIGAIRKKLEALDKS